MQLDEDLITQLSKEQDYVKTEIDELRFRVVKLKEELESIWRTETKTPYELTSVFVHRGASPSWGHYFFYSRNLPDQPDVWFKYNDSDVTEVSKDEVLADTTGSTANPYLVSYSARGIPTNADGL
jgi:ubiquitin carboxyl-terminal hydrolase 25/28